MEVRAHPGAQIDRFTHINDGTLGVFHDVTAGLGRQRSKDSLEVFRNFHAGILTYAKSPILALEVGIWMCYKSTYQL
jgi:hypothetical protein